MELLASLANDMNQRELQSILGDGENQLGLLVQGSANGDFVEATALLGEDDGECCPNEVVDNTTLSDYALTIASMNPEEIMVVLGK